MKYSLVSVFLFHNWFQQQKKNNAHFPIIYRHKEWLNQFTVGQNSHECRLKDWATRSFVYVRTLLRSLVCSLAHFTFSLACGTVNNWMAIFHVFFFYFGP